VWRALRIGFLLVILVLAAGTTWIDRVRTTRWTDTLWIGVFPVNGDGREATARYIRALGREDVADVEEFFGREASAHGVALDRPVRVDLHAEVMALPPLLDPDAGIPGRVWWSLRARYYAWRQAGDTLADVQVFVLYHDPATSRTVPHSLGLQKGLLGVAYAYAAPDMTETNNVVIAHEVMHTLGATDKYDPVTGLPVFPEGYGDRDAEPRHPQTTAEIMGGRTAISPTQAEMPLSLREVVVGPETAIEVNWRDH
jgi:hypothetical protein